jgi:hypothetical protein
MADIKERIIFDDTEVIKSLNDQFALVTKVNNAIRETELTYKEAYDIAQKQIDKTNDVVEEGTKAIGDNIAATSKARTESAGWKSALKGVADEMNILGVNLGRTVDQLRAKATAMKSAVSGINAGTNALKIFKVALISTGIGALIVAIGSLIAFFTKTEKGAEKLERVMAGVGAVIDVIVGRIAKLGDAVVKIFSGDWKGAMADAKDAVTGLNASLAAQVGIMVELKRREQELEDAKRTSRAEDAKHIVRLKELQLAADDNTKSTKERIAAIKEADEIEKQSLEDKKKIAEEDLAIEDARVAALKAANLLRDEDLEKQTDKQVALAEITAESLTRQRKIQSQTQGIIAEAAAKEAERLKIIQDQNRALDDQVQKIIEAADKVALEFLDPEARVNAEANAAKLIINEQFKKLDELARIAGKEVDLTEEKVALIEAIEKKSVRQIENIRNASIEKLADDVIKPLQGAERGAVDIVGNVQGAIKKMADSPEVEGSILSLSEKLQKAFNIDAETLNAIVAGIGSVFDAAFAATTANTDAAIEKNNELLDSIRERQDVLDDDLKKEEERQKAGLANSLDAKAAEREALKKEEEKAIKEQEKLAKKQLAQQLLQDALQQGSSIATMAANVAAKSSLLGPTGIPVAIATIAAFISIISKIKSSSKKLYAGGDINQEGVTGFVNRSGRTDRNGGRGHRVEDSNLILGGEEFVINGKTAAIHAPFLEALNRGEFDSGPGLAFAMKHGKDMEHKQAIASAYERRNATNSQAAAIERAIGRQMAALAGVIQNQENLVAYRPGDLIRREKAGKVTITQTETDWRWKPEARN